MISSRNRVIGYKVRKRVKISPCAERFVGQQKQAQHGRIDAYRVEPMDRIASRRGVGHREGRCRTAPRR